MNSGELKVWLLNQLLTAMNIVFSGLFFLIASRQDKGAEAKSIEDIRDFAWDQVSTDMDEVKQHVSDFKQSVKSKKFCGLFCYRSIAHA